jgi:Uma2 family endonuclease
MSVPVERYVTPEEYLAAEREAETKSEYFNGQVVARPSVSLNHARLASSVRFLLGTQLASGPCEGFGSDMRVKVEASASYVYPDVSVVCGELQLEEIAEVETLLNPTVIVEVLSNSTVQYHLGIKWLHYRELPSLQDYVLVSQDECRVEHYARQLDGRWLFSEARGLDEAIELESVGCRLPLDRLYARVKIERGQA